MTANVPISAHTMTPYQNASDHLQAGLACVEMRVAWAIKRARLQNKAEDNRDPFRGLYLTDEMIDDLLAQKAGLAYWNVSANGSTALWEDGIQQAQDVWQKRTELTAQQGTHVPLIELAQRFELTERDIEILLLVIAPEFDQRYEQLFGFLHDDVTKRRPTVDLLLALFTDTYSQKLALRKHFLPDSPLVKHHLIKLHNDGENRLSSFSGKMVIAAEAIVHFLLEQPFLSTSLRTAVEIIDPETIADSTWLSHELWQQIQAAQQHRPIFNFLGPYGIGKREAALRLAAEQQQKLFELNIDQLGKGSLPLVTLLQLALRDASLHNAVLYITHWDSILVDYRPPQALLAPLQGFGGTVILAGEKLWQQRVLATNARPIFSVSFPTFGYNDRVEVWGHYLEPHGGISQDDLSELANHFQFSPGQIRDAVHTAVNISCWKGEGLNKANLLEASRGHSNQNLAELAKKVPINVNWDDLILPIDPLTQLRELTNQARNRPTVHDKWGFGRKLPGRGISALFTGEPGTGKTMSAAIIAGDLGLDLYKVDLSSLVSKYIGETEKNLDRVFTEANTSNAVLFFDEADSIFGKRSEVKDSHDRYANLEISYLLQRVESYDGIAILATNMRANLDEAFTRRFDFITDFPFPDVSSRETIWRIHFPEQTPLAEDIDISLLASRFRLAGGNIKKIVLSAAFLAAQEGDSISMEHILHAVRREYQKMGRLIEDALFE